MALFLIAVGFLVWREHVGRIRTEQEFERFRETQSFTSVEFVLDADSKSLDRRKMSVDVVDRLWPIIEKAKPGSGPRKLFDILLLVYFTRPDGTTVTVSFRKDFAADEVRISFFLTGKAGYSLIGEDRDNNIDRIVKDYLDL